MDEEKAFAEYVSMGEDRSYRAVAKKFGVTKRCIVDVSRRKHWLTRLAKIEADAREMADKRLTETRSEVHERHLRMIRAMAARAAQGLQAHAFDNARDSARAAEAAIKLEREVLGEPTMHLDVTVAQVTRREVESLLTDGEDGDDDRW